MVLRMKGAMSVLVVLILLFVVFSYLTITLINMEHSYAIADEPIDFALDMDSDAIIENVDTYDLSKLYTFGDEEFCNVARHNKNGQLQYEYKYKYKSAMIGGLYNTGTNALLKLLQQNCFGLTPSRFHSTHTKRYYNQKKQEIMSSVKHFERFNFRSLYNISKHEAIPAMEQLMEKGIEYESDYSTQELYVIIIKDPLTWIRSMCKASYYVLFGRNAWKAHSKCPINIHSYNGSMTMTLWHAHLFANIVELYNLYYEGWLNGNETVGIATASRNRQLAQLAGIKFQEEPTKQFYLGLLKFVHEIANNAQFASKVEQHELYGVLQSVFTPIKLPHIVVRFEDVLFRPAQIVDKVCECVGGYRRSDRTVLQENAAKPHGQSKTRGQAIRSYSNLTYRYLNYLPQDLQFINHTINHTLMRMFAYTL